MTCDLDHAELSNDRMITDIGPECADCTPNGLGLYLYLVTYCTTATAPGYPGRWHVMAQCACCHKVTEFYLLILHKRTLEDLTVAHVRTAHADIKRYTNRLSLPCVPADAYEGARNMYEVEAEREELNAQDDAERREMEACAALDASEEE